jgi:hypothetical protein
LLISQMNSCRRWWWQEKEEIKNDYKQNANGDSKLCSKQ